MKLPDRARIEHRGLVLSALLSILVGGAANAASSTVVPIETIIDENQVYTKINEDVITRIPPVPVVAKPVDTYKLQISNKMDSGFITGQLTSQEMDEIRAMLDGVALQEADFKLQEGGLSAGAINNLMRKYNMVDRELDRRLANSNTADYMPSFETRRADMQRRIGYHIAASNLTLIEGEQLLTAIATVSDNYASARATGGTLSASELEGLHRDLLGIQAKLGQRVGATIAIVAPASHDKLAELNTTIQSAIANKQITAEEGARLMKQYNRLVLLQNSLVAQKGAYAPEIHLLAKEIDNLNFMISRLMHDRQIAGYSDKL